MMAKSGKGVNLMKHQHVEETKYCEECLIPDLLGYIPDTEYSAPLKKILAYNILTFSKRAKKYMVGYYITKFISFIAPLIITTITSLAIEETKYYVVFLSLVASLAVGVAGIGMFHENWIRYRETCEQLKSEVIQFIGDTGDYDKKELDQKIDLLGKRITNILKSETLAWKSAAKTEYTPPDNKSPGAPQNVYLSSSTNAPANNVGK